MSVLLSEMTTTITAVFAGGGIRGIALAGAAAGAMDAGYRFGQVVGTSAGALVGALVAAGYGPEELAETVCRLEWRALPDPVPGARLPVVGTHLALLIWKGVHRGDRLEEVWSELLARKGVRVFGDLPEGSLRMVAADITHERGVVLPDDLPRYGWDADRFPVARAARISASVPFVFRPVPLVDPQTGEEVLLVDGALAANFPIGVVGAAAGFPVVGFRLVNVVDPHPHRAVRGLASLAGAVMGSAIRSSETLPLPLPVGARVVEIPTWRSSLDFRLEPEEARAIFDRGRTEVRAQMSGHRAVGRAG